MISDECYQTFNFPVSCHSDSPYITRVALIMRNRGDFRFNIITALVALMDSGLSWLSVFHFRSVRYAPMTYTVKVECHGQADYVKR
jgi:hypothetical protein